MAIITVRSGTAAEWTTANPRLASGEQGLETDTRRIKIGNGTALWNALDYADKYVLDREHHTGYIHSNEIDDLLDYIQDALKTQLTPGTNIALEPDPSSPDKLRVSATGDAATDPVAVRQIVYNFLAEGSNVTLVRNPAGDQLVINSSGGGGGSAVAKTYATESAAQAGLLANEFADGDIIIVGP